MDAVRWPVCVGVAQSEDVAVDRSAPQALPGDMYSQLPTESEIPASKRENAGGWKSEVDQRRFAARAIEHVGRFQIEVDHVLPVNISTRCKRGAQLRISCGAIERGVPRR